MGLFLEHSRIIGDIFYFRIKIPVDVLHWFTAREILRSTRSRNKKDASIIISDLLSEARKVFNFLSKTNLSDDTKRAMVESLCPPRKQAPKPQVDLLPTGPTLAAVCEEFTKNAEINKKVIKTMYEIKFSLWLLCEVLGGERQIEFIGREELKSYRDALLKLPPNFTKSKEYRDKSVAELLTVQHEKVMSITTVNKQLSWASSLFLFAIRESYYPKSNPVDSLKLKKNTRANEDLPPYSDEQMQLFFNILTWDIKHPERFWVPLVCAFQGTRANEICQLYLDNIVLDKNSGLWCFDIIQTAKAGQFIPDTGDQKSQREIETGTGTSRVRQNSR